MHAEEELRTLRDGLARQQTVIDDLAHELGALRDMAEIERLQYA